MSLTIPFYPTPTLPAALQDVVVKNFKTKRSHEGATLSNFDLWLGKVKIGHVNEDDWSGSVMFTPVDKATEAQLDAYLKQDAVNTWVDTEINGDGDDKHVIDQNWSMIAIHKAVRKVFGFKKLNRSATNNILIGTPNHHVKIGWGVKLSEITAAEIEKEIKRGLVRVKKDNVAATVLNTPEQLTELGVDFKQQ